MLLIRKAVLTSVIFLMIFGVFGSFKLSYAHHAVTSTSAKKTVAYDDGFHTGCEDVVASFCRLTGRVWRVSADKGIRETGAVFDLKADAKGKAALTFTGKGDHVSQPLMLQTYASHSETEDSLFSSTTTVHTLFRRTPVPSAYRTEGTVTDAAAGTSTAAGTQVRAEDYVNTAAHKEFTAAVSEERRTTESDSSSLFGGSSSREESSRQPPLPAVLDISAGTVRFEGGRSRLEGARIRAKRLELLDKITEIRPAVTLDTWYSHIEDR